MVPQPRTGRGIGNRYPPVFRVGAFERWIPGSNGYVMTRRIVIVIEGVGLNLIAIGGMPLRWWGDCGMGRRRELGRVYVASIIFFSFSL